MKYEVEAFCKDDQTMFVVKYKKLFKWNNERVIYGKKLEEIIKEISKDSEQKKINVIWK